MAAEEKRVLKRFWKIGLGWACLSGLAACGGHTLCIGTGTLNCPDSGSSSSSSSGGDSSSSSSSSGAGNSFSGFVNPATIQFGATTVVGVQITNSLATSPDGGTLYFTDTPKRLIFAFDLEEESGSLSNRRVLVEVTEGYPDGAVVDAQGCLWSARWGAGEVVRHAPDGAVMSRLKVPARQPTCPAFGGPDRKTLFVTSAREGLDAAALAKDPEAGNLYVFESDVAGLPVAPFKPSGR